MLATFSLFPIAVATTPAMQQKNPSLLQAVIPEPTGQNGLEDYLKAIDLLNDNVSEIYAGPPAYVSPFLTDDEKAARARLADEIKPLDYLAVRRLFADRYGDAYDLIVQGNQKPCFTPPPASDTAPKGFPSAIQVAQLIQSRAYRLSAEGKQSESLDTLLNGLSFTLRSGSFNTMAYMSDLLGERTIFDELLDEFPRMSLPDLQRIDAYVTDALKQPPLVEGIVRQSEKVHELKFAKVDAARAIKDYPEYGKLLTNATPDQLDALWQGVKSATTDAYRAQEQVLDRPESEWYDGSAGWTAQFGESTPHDGDSIAQLAASFGHMIVSPFRHLALNELRRRAQLRLLGLHARILEYRWHNHRLPDSLSQVADAHTAFDPLSGEPFEYATGSDGTYRLLSKGRPDTGPIELHYNGKAPSLDIQP